jgi:uncharacterized protein YjiS (DUF1127 family)
VEPQGHVESPPPQSVACSPYRLGPRVSQPAPIARLAARLTSTIGLWSARSRQRRALQDLATLNAHLLKDIGVTPDEAAREAAKWFWQDLNP